MEKVNGHGAAAMMPYADKNDVRSRRGIAT